jgi:hypothetical protein
MCMDWIHLAQDRDSCEQDNDISGSIKCRQMLMWLSDCWLLKKDSSPCRKLLSVPDLKGVTVQGTVVSSPC